MGGFCPLQLLLWYFYGDFPHFFYIYLSSARKSYPLPPPNPGSSQVLFIIFGCQCLLSPFKSRTVLPFFF